MAPCGCAASVPALLSRLRGPWALAYWQASSGTLWFGRDFLGRRSLLFHGPCGKGGSFLLASVCPSFKLKGWDEEHRGAKAEESEVRISAGSDPTIRANANSSIPGLAESICGGAGAYDQARLVTPTICQEMVPGTKAIGGGPCSSPAGAMQEPCRERPQASGLQLAASRGAEHSSSGAVPGPPTPREAAAGGGGCGAPEAARAAEEAPRVEEASEARGSVALRQAPVELKQQQGRERKKKEKKNMEEEGRKAKKGNAGGRVDGASEPSAPNPEPYTSRASGMDRLAGQGCSEAAGSREGGGAVRGLHCHQEAERGSGVSACREPPVLGAAFGLWTDVPCGIFSARFIHSHEEVSECRREGVERRGEAQGVTAAGEMRDGAVSSAVSGGGVSGAMSAIELPRMQFYRHAWQDETVRRLCEWRREAGGVSLAGWDGGGTGDSAARSDIRVHGSGQSSEAEEETQRGLTDEASSRVRSSSRGGGGLSEGNDLANDVMLRDTSGAGHVDTSKGSVHNSNQPAVPPSLQPALRDLSQSQAHAQSQVQALSSAHFPSCDELTPADHLLQLLSEAVRRRVTGVREVRGAAERRGGERGPEGSAPPTRSAQCTPLASQSHGAGSSYHVSAPHAAGAPASGDPRSSQPHGGTSRQSRATAASGRYGDEACDAELPAWAGCCERRQGCALASPRGAFAATHPPRLPDPAGVPVTPRTGCCSDASHPAGVPCAGQECTAPVALLFSGGLDCMVLAALAHRHVDRHRKAALQCSNIEFECEHPPYLPPPLLSPLPTPPPPRPPAASNSPSHIS